MTKFASHLTSILALCTLAACTSKVSTTLSPEEQRASDAKPASSSVELLEMTARSEAATCSPQNKVRILVTENSDRPIKCRDNTRRSPALAAGLVCPAGVTVPDFTSSSAWTDCASVKVCGQAARTARDLSSSPAARMQQLDFAALPWGCAGSLEWAFADQIQNADLIKKIEIDIAPPPCPTCPTTGTPTCEVCGVDNGKPIITEVLGEVADCNQIRVLVFAEDRESGLHRDAYSFDGGATWQSSSEYIFNGMTLALAPDKVRVRDRAGNITLGTRTTLPVRRPLGRAHSARRIARNIQGRRRAMQSDMRDPIDQAHVQQRRPLGRRDLQVQRVQDRRLSEVRPPLGRTDLAR